jgi:hypothetical protein
MKRRDFVKMAGVAPLGLLPFPKKKSLPLGRIAPSFAENGGKDDPITGHPYPYPKNLCTLIDYSNSGEYKYGRMFRRIFYHKDVPEHFVKHVTYCRKSRQLWIGVYEITPLDPDCIRTQSTYAKYLHRTTYIREVDGCHIYETRLPIDDFWHIKQYDRHGELIHTITNKNLKRID